MDRNIAIFSGGSNVLGLGLELEFDPQLNDDLWLKENGIKIPLPRLPHYKNYWKKYRWSKLVCDDLGLIEYNIHDERERLIGGTAVETIFALANEMHDDFLDILKKTKYIFLELNYIRWWDYSLHGNTANSDLPTTASEIMEFINNPSSDNVARQKALEWVVKLDEKLFWNETLKKFSILKKKFPEIKFILIPFGGNKQDYGDIPVDSPDVVYDYLETNLNCTIEHYLRNNGLMIYHKAKAYNGNYKYNILDSHMSSDGHRFVADLCIQYIKKLEDDKKR